jgi:hypothetical protein
LCDGHEALVDVLAALAKFVHEPEHRFEQFDGTYGGWSLAAILHPLHLLLARDMHIFSDGLVLSLCQYLDVPTTPHAIDDHRRRLLLARLESACTHRCREKDGCARTPVAHNALPVQHASTLSHAARKALASCDEPSAGTGRTHEAAPGQERSGRQARWNGTDVTRRCEGDGPPPMSVADAV